MNTTNLIQRAKAKKRESVLTYLRLAFNDFVHPVYLFGSYATGHFHGYSDVDILIISPDALSAEVYRQACDKMTELSMNYDILISSSLDRLDSSIVSSLQAISATAPCVALPPASMQSHTSFERKLNTSPYPRELGFTLVEVLVSMIILAVGLLGLASLQGISLKNNQDAYLYSQANALAYEMSDLIKANRTYWTKTTTYTPPLVTAAPALATPCPTTCSTAATACTTDQMAAHDYCYWQQKAISRLSAGATVDIKTSTGSTNCPGTFPQLCLTISWSRVNNKNLNATSSYQLEVTP